MNVKEICLGKGGLAVSVFLTVGCNSRALVGFERNTETYQIE